MSTENDPEHGAGLTPKQERFCHEYVIDLNATQAAIRAGYSKHTAQEQGSRLLSKVMVKARVAELQGAAAKRSDVTQDRVIEMLLAAYEDAKVAKQYGPAVRAAELLGRRLGMFKDVMVSEFNEPDAGFYARIAQEMPELAAALAKLLPRPQTEKPRTIPTPAGLLPAPKPLH